MRMKTISVVIPVYNEGENVEVIYARVCAVFANALAAYALEVIFSDNCSTDDTYARITRLHAQDTRVKGVRLSRNFGYQANILTGYMNARGAAVVQMDADGEDPPEVLPQLVAEWERGHQVVYGVRVKRHEPLLMQLQRRIFYGVLNRIAAINLVPGAGDFRLLDRAVVDILCQRFQERNPYLRGLTSYIGFHQTGVPYERGRRLKGVSKFSYMAYLRLAWDAITSFSHVPLKFVSVLGFSMAVVAVLGFVFYLGLYLTGMVEAKGFTTLVLVILFLSGTQLLCLGILGEYIDRIFDEVKARPRGIVAESCGFDTPARSV
jgi:dolichol-phosphate mannosyltransferase